MRKSCYTTAIYLNKRAIIVESIEMLLTSQLDSNGSDRLDTTQFTIYFPYRDEYMHANSQVANALQSLRFATKTAGFCHYCVNKWKLYICTTNFHRQTIELFEMAKPDWSNRQKFGLSLQ